jgi:hypothetical protein
MEAYASNFCYEGYSAPSAINYEVDAYLLPLCDGAPAKGATMALDVLELLSLPKPSCTLEVESLFGG